MGPTYSQRREENQTGTYVTIYDAYERKYRNISDEAFDRYFDEMEGVEVIQQTRPQRTAGVYNENRGVKLRNTTNENALIDIGTYIVVQGQKFNIIYDGMTRYCTLCKRKHGTKRTECPTKVRREHLQKLRLEFIDKMKMYSAPYNHST